MPSDGYRFDVLSVSGSVTYTHWGLKHNMAFMRSHPFARGARMYISTVSFRAQAVALSEMVFLFDSATGRTEKLLTLPSGNTAAHESRVGFVMMRLLPCLCTLKVRNLNRTGRLGHRVKRGCNCV